MERRSWTRRLPTPLADALRDPATLRDRFILALVLGAPVSARGRTPAARGGARQERQADTPRRTGGREAPGAGGSAGPGGSDDG
jgi:hypothetical protein